MGSSFVVQQPKGQLGQCKSCRDLATMKGQLRLDDGDFNERAMSFWGQIHSVLRRQIAHFCAK